MDLIFKVLADKSRRKILEVLKEKDMTVGEIAKHFTFTGATLSHHLDILKKTRLVVSERKGQYVKYSLNTSVFEEMIALFLNIFQRKGENL
ncbi:MAG TPA: autorepressor SdpR family transcription factor [Patescibacteria group bacterium]|nr:autorepressor SdpR family transcription factor [Patescibacteria group bacterium]